MNKSSSLSAILGRYLVPAIPYLWLLLLFLTPFLIVFKISLSDMAVSQPPYTPQLEYKDLPSFIASLPDFFSKLDFENYQTLLGVPLSSFLPAIGKTVLALLVGVPLAFYFACKRGAIRWGTSLILIAPYILCGFAMLLAMMGMQGLLDWVWQVFFAKETVGIVSLGIDWVMGAYLCLPFVVFPIVCSFLEFRQIGYIYVPFLPFVRVPILWWGGQLYPRHYVGEKNILSLSLAANTVWRKAKVGLLIAIFAGFAAAVAHMMQREFNGDPIYWEALLSSLRIAVLSTILLLLVGFPIAYSMARAPTGWRPILMAVVMLPFWTSFLIRIYSWKMILEPLHLLNTEWAVFIGIVYGYLPFMILPLYATLEKMDQRLIEAATDLGSPPWRTFWTITIPLAMPGIFAGSLLCFIPVVGEFVIPDLLGGSDTLMIGKVLYSEYSSNRDWPLASTVAVVLLLILVIPIVLYQRVEKIELDIDHQEAKP